MIKAILFDLDGTLLPNNEELFAKLYFKAFATKMAKYGYDPQKFVDGMQLGAKYIVLNDGKRTNEEVFKEGFNQVTGKDVNKDEDIVNDFYNNEYKESFPALDKDEDALKALIEAKNKGLKVILASNPLFPRIAYLNRAIYNDLKEEYFDEVTSYDLYHYAKPNPKYYEEILSRHNLKVDEVIFFGNSKKHDIDPASSIGIKSYLVHDDGGISSKEMLDIIKAI